MFVSRDQHSEFPLPINSILGVAVSLLLKYILKEYDSKYLPRHEPFPRAPNQTPRKIRSGTSLDRSQDNVYVNTTFSQISTILNDFRERLELRHSNDTSAWSSHLLPQQAPTLKQTQLDMRKMKEKTNGTDLIQVTLVLKNLRIGVIIITRRTNSMQKIVLLEVVTRSMTL
jgi:hypothetical protein